MIAWLFRSTPPREGRPSDTVEFATWWEMVSIHAPTRGATQTRSARAGCEAFRSTPPREGRPAPTWKGRLPSGFDPRPHARGDPQRRTGCGRAVSIHAPTRGATTEADRSRNRRCNRVSIHAPTRGATAIRPSRVVRNVSIHAPTRGATQTRMAVRSAQVSIHAPTRGATGRRRGREIAEQFRSTPPREGRRMAHRDAPTRGATTGVRQWRRSAVSIHAPTRGATREVSADRSPPRPHRGDAENAMEFQVSIHAPTRGATNHRRGAPSRACFDPRPHARGDGGCEVDGFDPRPHARGDHSCNRVSIHAPTRGATPLS